MKNRYWTSSMKNANQFVMRLSLFGFLLLVIGSSVSALAAANTVPVSYADDITIPIDQTQFIPPQCAGMSFDNIIYGEKDKTNPITIIWGTKDNDLIYGTPWNDEIHGDNGKDCIVGGDGDDVLYGDNGGDVLIGGPGFDTIDGGNGKNSCYTGELNTNCEP